MVCKDGVCEIEENFVPREKRMKKRMLPIEAEVEKRRHD